MPSDRRALQSVAVQFLANGLIYATFIPRLPEIRDRVDISIGTMGLLLTLGSLAGLIGSFLTGPVIERFGTKQVLVVGGVCSVAALPVIGVATTPALLVVGLAGVVFFDVFVDVAMNVQGSVLSARRRSPVMNRLHGLWSLGTVGGGMLTALVAGAGVSVTVHFTIAAVVLAALLLYVAPGLLPVDEPHEPDAAVEHVGDPRRFGLAALLFLLSGAAAMAMEVGATDWAAFRLDDDFGAGARVAAGAFVAFTVGMTVGRFGGDFVQSRLGALLMQRGAAVVAGFGLALATLVPDQTTSLVGFLLAGLGTSVMFPQLYDAAARVPGPPGSGFTAMLIGQRGAALLVPLAIGSLADTDLSVGSAIAIVTLPAAGWMFVSTFNRSSSTRTGQSAET